MKLGLSIGYSGAKMALPMERILKAEALGFDSVWAAETYGSDAITPLADDGVIWVLTPKTGRPGHVLPAEIAESAPTAGLMPTSSVNLGDWSASRLVQPKSRAGRR